MYLLFVPFSQQSPLSTDYLRAVNYSNNLAFGKFFLLFFLHLDHKNLQLYVINKINYSCHFFNPFMGHFVNKLNRLSLSGNIRSGEISNKG